MLKQVSHQKKDWLPPAKHSFFCMIPIVKLCSVVFPEPCQCHIKRRLGWDGTKQGWFWYDNDKDLRPVFTWRRSCFRQHSLYSLVDDSSDELKISPTRKKTDICVVF